MTDALARIETWLAAHAPKVLKGLGRPASEDAIREAEQALGITFPDAVRDAYLRHDGQDRFSPGLFEGWEWLSLERMVDEWGVWKGLLDDGDFEDTLSDGDDATVRSDWWHPAWIPLTYSGGGDHHCLDLAPGPAGVSGQIIEMWHDDAARSVVASGFEDFLAAYADKLESGAVNLG